MKVVLEETIFYGPVEDIQDLQIKVVVEKVLEVVEGYPPVLAAAMTAAEW